MTMTDNELKDGRVVAIAGPVIDVEFPRGALPELNTALEFQILVDGNPISVLAEVAQQLGEGRVRAVCMKPTDGLTRGTTVRNTGRGISVPVGDKVLGHVWNVWGQPLDEAPEGFEVYSGDDWATFGYVCLGAVGVVSVASHLVGSQIRQMIDLIETGDVPAARKLHEDLSPLFNALFVTSNPIPVKAALDMLGRPAGPPRLPLVPATPEERDRIKRALEDAGHL